MTIEHTHMNTIPPVFKIQDKDLTKDDTTLEEMEVSFFDVKDLYDRAYAAKDAGREDYKAKEMMAQAIKMDMTYRCQLARKSSYMKVSQMNDFKILAKAS